MTNGNSSAGNAISNVLSANGGQADNVDGFTAGDGIRVAQADGHVTVSANAVGAGTSAVCSVPASKMGDERHVIGLVGKLLNAPDELAATDALASEVFKQIITGEPLTVRDLYKSAFDFRPLPIRQDQRSLNTGNTARPVWPAIPQAASEQKSMDMDFFAPDPGACLRRQ